MDVGPVTGVRGVVKVTRFQADNDLSSAEAATLATLFPETAGDVKFYRYLPRPLTEPFLNFGRHVNVLSYIEGHLTLEEILQRLPKGIDFRDMVWMFKRTLVAIGFAHTRGVIHGAVLPPHIMVHPTGHGAKLVDWSYAIAANSKASIKAYPAAYRDYLAPEVLAKQFPTPATDIYMAAMTAVSLLVGGPHPEQLAESARDIPKPIQDFLVQCLAKRPNDRPQNAWDLHEALDKLLLTVVGKPAYRPFALPT